MSTPEKPQTGPQAGEALHAVLKAIAQSCDWDRAKTAEQCFLYQLRAAHNVGRFQPFTREETELNAHLTQLQAGKRLCDYAWRCYAQSLGEHTSLNAQKR